jgi:putative ABC transport system permease protein
VNINGCTYNLPPLVALEIAAGRFFSEAEDQAGAAVAVIGWDVKDELFANLDPLGRELLIAGVPHRIVGVMEQQGRMLGQSQDQQAYLPMRAWRKLYGNRASIDILIRAKGGVPGLDASMDETRAVLRALRHASFKDPDPFGIFTYEGLQTLWRQISAAAFILSMLVSSVSLGVGGVVIMNIMLVGVVERTREIGVRLALGARKRDIRRQFLLEAALLSTAGGVIGLVIGTAAASTVRGFLSFPAKTTPTIVVSSLLLSTVVGLAAGYWPARGASNLPVVDALRDET